MPLYSYRCTHGHEFSRYTPLAQYREYPLCDCGSPTEIVITAPLLVTVQPNVCYDSPVTGEPITSMAQRREDLARHNCQDYDPMMKDDYLRRQKESADHLDQSIDRHLDETWEKMPTATRGKLASEVVEQGLTAEYQRGSR